MFLFALASPCLLIQMQCVSWVLWGLVVCRGTSPIQVNMTVPLDDTEVCFAEVCVSVCPKFNMMPQKMDGRMDGCHPTCEGLDSNIFELFLGCFASEINATASACNTNGFLIICALQSNSKMTNRISAVANAWAICHVSNKSTMTIETVFALIFSICDTNTGTELNQGPVVFPARPLWLIGLFIFHQIFHH